MIKYYGKSQNGKLINCYVKNSVYEIKQIRDENIANSKAEDPVFIIRNFLTGNFTTFPEKSESIYVNSINEMAVEMELLEMENGSLMFNVILQIDDYDPVTLTSYIGASSPKILDLYPRLYSYKHFEAPNMGQTIVLGKFNQKYLYVKIPSESPDPFSVIIGFTSEPTGSVIWTSFDIDCDIAYQLNGEDNTGESQAALTRATLALEGVGTNKEEIDNINSKLSTVDINGLISI